MLSILANSASFREAARTFNVALWKSLEDRVRINADSIEYFAKVRGLNWKHALETTARIFSNAQTDWNEKHPGIPIDHPHHYIVPQGSQSLQRPKYKNQNQINIARCDYFRSDFRGYSRPSNWPAEKPYPSDPTISNEPCELCLLDKCACEITDSPEVLKPLVELQRYGNKGVGIRALQRFEADEILGEYVGEILPWDCKDDSVYGMSFMINDTHIAMISSQFRGNWTRFLNHSCDSNTEFTYMTIGGRRRIMVVAVKPVEMFEELTVDYGGNYFHVAHGIFCICGSPKCRYKKSPD